MASNDQAVAADREHAAETSSTGPDEDEPERCIRQPDVLLRRAGEDHGHDEPAGPAPGKRQPTCDESARAREASG